MKKVSIDDFFLAGRVMTCKLLICCLFWTQGEYREMLQRQMEEKEERQKVEREREKAHPLVPPHRRPSHQESFQTINTVAYNEREENELQPFLLTLPSFGESTQERRGNSTMTKVSLMISAAIRMVYDVNNLL